MPLYRSQSNVIFFVHIPKTGGTSVEAALRNAGAAEAMRFKGKRPFSKSTLQHIHAEIYEEAVGEAFADYSFTVVRNPYARFASEFKMKVADVGGQDTVEQWAHETFTRCAEFAYTRDNHIRPQVDFLSDRLEIFKFEDGLDRPVRAATGRLALPMPSVPHKKPGSGQTIAASTAAISAIHEFYRDDFDRLGYAADSYSASFEVVS